LENKTKITGYRELSQDEIVLINEIKDLARQVGRLVDCLEFMNNNPLNVKEDDNFIHPDQHWVAIGKTNLQQGFMALTRAVAKPESF
jgi:hypothetical protein